MEILFYRYNSICEPDIIQQFKNFGITVVEETAEITQKGLLPSQRVELLMPLLEKHNFLFVFSINFFPSVSDICQIFQVPYVCWSVDSPVMELFTPSIQNSCNRTFLFDRRQAEDVAKIKGSHDNLFHLPLATNAQRWDSVLSSISHADRQRFSCDISFVGSLYSEKNPYLDFHSLSAYTKGYADGLIDAQRQLIGSNILMSGINEQLVSEMQKETPGIFAHEELYKDDSRRMDGLSVSVWLKKYIIAHHILGMQASSLNRLELLSALSEHHHVTLFTQSDASQLKAVDIRGGVKTLTEMPKVFHLSKINLNMTIFPIQSGLSLRIWDILGCGGFLMTNYQEELEEYFTPGKDLECYTCKEDLLEKCDFYLTHENIRLAVAQSGYEKLKKMHTYQHRITEMIRLLTQEASLD